jgi:hypothetical protein
MLKVTLVLRDPRFEDDVGSSGAINEWTRGYEEGLGLLY